MIRKNIPNFITCINLISGSLAVISALYGELVQAVIFIFIAALLDFLDGLAARLFNAYSPIGKDLDSLADMISFGLAPGMIMFVLLKLSFTENGSQLLTLQAIPYISLLIPVFSAVRLAIFNNDIRQSSSFIGLPTPANAIFICSIALIHTNGKYPAFDSAILSTPSLVVISILFSLLLVSKIQMFSLKFENLKWNSNQIRMIFLLISATLIIIFAIYGIAAVIIIYIILSLLRQIVQPV
jgi:CDP-diacylglycerol---serine O-phosphatidyltransferase